MCRTRRTCWTRSGGPSHGAERVAVEVKLPRLGQGMESGTIVRGLKDRIRERVHAAVAEVDHQDLWQRAALGVAVVSGESHQVTEMLASVRRLVEGTFGAELIYWQEQNV